MSSEREARLTPKFIAPDDLEFVIALLDFNTTCCKCAPCAEGARQAIEKLKALAAERDTAPFSLVKRPELRHPPLAIQCRCDGNQVYAMIGKDPMEGCVGYGENLPEALRALAIELEREVGQEPLATLDPPCPQCNSSRRSIRCIVGADGGNMLRCEDDWHGPAR